jgi:hypothetical protein
LNEIIDKHGSLEKGILLENRAELLTVGDKLLVPETLQEEEEWEKLCGV